MAKQLQGVEAEYVFFCAYLAKDDEKAASDVNGAMLKNFLDALAITGADKKIKRFVLTAGAKQYGVHLGPPKNPMVESDKWLESSDRPPNFYYTQQRILADAAKGKNWDWVVTYPNDVIGVAKGNFMNLATSVGLYAAISAAIPDSECPFPGSETFYTGFDSFTYAPLHAQFVLWAAMEPRCGNEAFNVVNGDVESWQNLWPKLIRGFGGKVPPKQFQGEAKDGSMMELAERPPIAEYEEGMGLLGRTKRGKVEQKIDLMKWAEKKEVKETWKQLAEKHGLEENALEKATWMFLGFVLGRNYDLIISMSKARKLGWTGYKDTWEAFEEAFDELEKEKVLPPMKK